MSAEVTVELSDGAMSAIWSLAGGFLSAEMAAVRTAGNVPQLTPDSIRQVLTLATETYLGMVAKIRTEPIKASVGMYVHAEWTIPGLDRTVMRIQVDTLPDGTEPEPGAVIDLDAVRRHLGR